MAWLPGVLGLAIAIRIGFVVSLFITHPSVAQPLPEQRARRYMELLHAGSTARRSAQWFRKRATAAGFVAIDPLNRTQCETATPGSALLFSWRSRTLVLARVGQQPLEQGLTVVGAHIDAPALRIAPKPVAPHASGIGLRAYAYGGIKPFHYRDRALRLVGVVVRKGGTVANVDIGGDDFAFVAIPVKDRTDRGLIAERKRGEFILHAAGSTSPSHGASTRATLANRLRSDYNLTFADFAASEIYAVPREKPREVGLRRHLIGGFGHDDRSLSFAAFEALLRRQRVAHTALVFLADREEVGSTGPSGARAHMLEQVIGCLLEARATPKTPALVHRVAAASIGLSTDVKSAINPNWPEVQERTNAPIIGHGPTLVKYTGSRGKRGASDAHPELAAYIRRVANAAGVPHQYSETGRVDEGGGGTIAKFMAAVGLNVIDVGIPLLSMHAPFEVLSKQDLNACVDLFAAVIKAGPR